MLERKLIIIYYLISEITNSIRYHVVVTLKKKKLLGCKYHVESLKVDYFTLILCLEGCSLLSEAVHLFAGC